MAESEAVFGSRGRKAVELLGFLMIFSTASRRRLRHAAISQNSNLLLVYPYDPDTIAMLSPPAFALFLLFLFVDQGGDLPDGFFMSMHGSGSQTPDISGHRGRPCILSRPQQLPVCRRDRTHRRRQKCRGLMYASTTV